MIGRNKLLAGVGAGFALLLAFQLMPKRTIGISKKPASLASLESSKGARSKAPELKRGIVPSRSTELAQAGPTALPSALEAAPEAAVAPIEPQPAEAPAPGSAASDSASSEAPMAGAPSAVARETINLGAAGLTGAEAAQPDPDFKASLPNPWEPVVTRTEGPVALENAAKEQPGFLPKANDHDEAWPVGSVSDKHPSVAPILAAHPDRQLILCLAGCGKGIAIVQIRQRAPVLADAAEFVMTSSGPVKARAGDVICIAGCTGRPGEVVFNNVRLSWISDQGRSEVKAALRTIASRIIANEGLDIEDFARLWVSRTARGFLTGESGHNQFAFAAPDAAAWMRASPIHETLD